MKASQAEKAYQILKTYSGSNNQICYFKFLYEKNSIILSEYQIEYILANHDFEPFDVNKILPISSDYGSQLKEKLELEFTPKLLWIGRVIGEMGMKYHCYIQYRKSVAPKLFYVPKKYILHPLVKVDYKDLNIDFDKYDKITENLNRKLKEHQKEAVKFLLANKRCILADSMGLGKTTSAIVAALEGGFKKILVITTASLRTTWKREISLYEDPNNVTIINRTKWKTHTKFTIINYDVLHNFYKLPLVPSYESREVTDEKTGKKVKKQFPVYIKNKNTKELEPKMTLSRSKSVIKGFMDESPLYLEGFDCVIIDEVHKLANSTSMKYMVTNHFLHSTEVSNIFMLTGTPITNRPLNLYNILRLIDADVVMDYNYYMKRYCGAKTIHLKSGKEIVTKNEATNLDELREKIKHLYIRRLVSDVPDMVNKIISTRYYDLSDEQMVKYNKLWDEYMQAQNFIDSFTKEDCRQLIEGGLVRQYLAEEMIPNTVDLVNDYLEDGHKVIIVCTFQNEVDKFMKIFKKEAVCFDGRMDDKQKNKSVDCFMSDDKVRVFVGNINAMSVGITLTASDVMIFNSYSWAETDNRQCQDRIWRLTQTKDVECIYQLFTDSISQDMFEKVTYKGQIMDSVIKKESEK